MIRAKLSWFLCDATWKAYNLWYRRWEFHGVFTNDIRYPRLSRICYRKWWAAQISTFEAPTFVSAVGFRIVIGINKNTFAKYSRIQTTDGQSSYYVSWANHLSLSIFQTLDWPWDSTQNIPDSHVVEQANNTQKNDWAPAKLQSVKSLEHDQSFSDNVHRSSAEHTCHYAHDFVIASKPKSDTLHFEQNTTLLSALRHTNGKRPNVVPVWQNFGKRPANTVWIAILFSRNFFLLVVYCWMILMLITCSHLTPNCRRTLLHLVLIIQMPTNTKCSKSGVS